MTNKSKSNWRDDYSVELTLETLKKMYAPASRYRVSEFAYPAGTRFNGLMIQGKCFVFVGAVSYKFSCVRDFHLSEGEYADLPAGNYELTVGDCDAKFACVWEIPRKSEKSGSDVNY